jgi:hypothetical protein
MNQVIVQIALTYALSGYSHPVLTTKNYFYRTDLLHQIVVLVASGVW